MHGGDDLAEVHRFIKVFTLTNVQLGDEEADELHFDLTSHIPWEEVVGLETTLPILRSEELCVKMRSLTYLHLDEVGLSTWFVEPDIRQPHTFKDLLRSLARIVITEPTLSGGDWSPLMDFLSRREAAGNGISSIRLIGHPHMDQDVVRTIGRSVDAFENKRGVWAWGVTSSS